MGSQVSEHSAHKVFYKYCSKLDTDKNITSKKRHHIRRLGNLTKSCDFRAKLALITSHRRLNIRLTYYKISPVHNGVEVDKNI